jgi:hypothetical protein
MSDGMSEYWRAKKAQQYEYKLKETLISFLRKLGVTRKV